jgi:ATP-dependent Lhr-like helicase
VVHEVLASRGACFPQELLRATKLLPEQAAEGLSQLVGLGLASCDGFGGLRELLGRRRRRGRREAPPAAVGRWSLLRHQPAEAPDASFVARAYLRRYGVVFRRLLERERVPVPWRPVLLALRTLEARGEVRGGRFVANFPGEQYALPQAVELLRRLRRQERVDREPALVSAADPLNLAGILTPDPRVAGNARQRVAVA